MNSLQNLNRQGLLLPGNAKAVVDQLVCGICLDLFLNPVQCHRGGHTYCLHCITEHTRENPMCPGGCNVDFPILPPTKSIVAQGCVDSLQCRCPHAPEVAIEDEPPEKKARKEGAKFENPIVLESAGGSSSGSSGSSSSSSSSSSSNSSSSSAGQCTWTGPFAQLRDHLERCGLEPCRSEGCAFRGTGGVLAAHRLACPKRRVPCPHCQEATALDSLEGHLEVCGEMTARCPYAHMGCPTSLARKSMPAHLKLEAAQHTALLEANEIKLVPSATIELTIKNVQQKIEGNTEVKSPKVNFPMVGFPQGQVCIEVCFGAGSGRVQRRVQRNGKTLGVFAMFECSGAPAVEPPPKICYQGTTVTLVSQDGAVKNEEGYLTSLDDNAPLGMGWGHGWPTFCQDITPFVKDDTIVVRATIRARPTAPFAAALKHTVA